MARTPVTAAELEAYLRWLLHYDTCEMAGLTEMTLRHEHDAANGPSVAVEFHRKGRCLRIEAIGLRVVRCVAWEHGAPAGPDGERAVKRNYAGDARTRAGVDVDGVRGWLNWLNGGSEP